MKHMYKKYGSFALIAIAMLLFAWSPSVAFASSGAGSDNEEATSFEYSLVAELLVSDEAGGFESEKETQEIELSSFANDESANRESDLSQDDSPEQEDGGESQDAEEGGISKPDSDIDDNAPVSDSGYEGGFSDDVTLDNPGQSSVKPLGIGDYDYLPVMPDGDFDENSSSETEGEVGNGQIEDRESLDSTVEVADGNVENRSFEKDQQTEQSTKVLRQKKTRNAANEAISRSNVTAQTEIADEIDSKVSKEALGSQESDIHEASISRVSAECGIPQVAVGVSPHDDLNSAATQSAATWAVNYCEQCHKKHEAMRDSGSRHPIPFDVFFIHLFGLKTCGFSFLPESQLTTIVRSYSFGRSLHVAILDEATNGSADNQYSFVGCEQNGLDARGFKRAHRCRSP